MMDKTAEHLGIFLGALWEKDATPNKRLRDLSPALLPEEMGRPADAFFHPIDDYGKVCVKTKQNASYSYDTFVLFDDGTGRGDPRVNQDWTIFETDGIIRSQRYRDLAQKHFGHAGHYWNRRSAKSIEAFLRDFAHNSKLVLVRILEGCNIGNGYPFWIFRTVEKNNETTN